MRRNGYIVLSTAALAWVGVAIGLSAGGPSRANTALPPSGPSPACSLAPADASAALPGAPVDVSPAPGTDTADPHAQLSFRGIPVTQIRDVSVTGSRSGRHEGVLHGYFQGDGASFVPYRPFRDGELVRVRATLDLAGAARTSAYSFRVATPYPTSGIPPFPQTPAPAAAYQSFVSAPQLQAPVLQVTVPDRDPAAGALMMSTGPGPGVYGPLIYTPQGRLVWFEPLPRGEAALNLSVQRYEGAEDLTWWRGHVLSAGFGQGADVITDSSYQTVATVRAGNGYEADLHDFQLAPRGVAFLTAYNVMRCDLSSVGGARNGVIIDTVVQELDIRTGLVRWEWHSLDHVGAAESHAPLPAGAIPWDYFHLNSVDAEPGGDLLVSGRSTWAAYQLQAGSGQIVWRLGGTRNSFKIGAGSETAWQHDARMQPDGTITMFDDGSSPRVHYQSRAVRIAIDATRRSARLVAAYAHPGSPLLADSQGNVQALGSGDVVIGWGAIPDVSELAADGRPLLDAHLPPGYSSYRAFRFPWSGHPIGPPAASARLLGTRDSTAVFASWNGATEVAAWRVLAGPQPNALTAQATMPDSGFESSLTFPDPEPEHPYAYVAVQALSAGGQTLGTSATVRVVGA